MVTGDYVVGGWNKSTGTITIPDPEAYATNVQLQQVPAGADIVAAYVYWQTVENSGSYAGQNGSFRGFPFTGAILGNPNAPVSWSSGGCAGSSQGSKTIVTYRAEVSSYIPIDANGNVPQNFSLSLPDTGKAGQPPYTLGATLVIIYRLLAAPPTVPLKAVVIYDGSYAPSNTAQVATQPILGFYQAGNDPLAKITHIVGNGQINKLESISLNNYKSDGTLAHSTPLPSLYPGKPPFPGNYNNSWDNPTWLVNDPSYASNATPTGALAVQAGESAESTLVVPASSNKGCVSWGAVILSTTVQDSDNDGLMDTWKLNQGYCDAAANRGLSTQGTCPKATSDPSWVALPGATHNNQDVFIQLDYMCTKVINNADGTTTCDPTGVSYKPSQQAISDLTSAFTSHGHNINVHIVTPPSPQNQNQVALGPDDNNVILAQTCTDNTAVSPAVYCPFPGQAGVVDWKSGFSLLKNQPLNYPDEDTCETQTPVVNGVKGTPDTGPLCVRRFQSGRRNSYHEVIFSAASALYTWSFGDSSLASISVSGSTITFNTTNPHGLVPDPTDTGAANGRVSVANVASNPSLNGTFLVQTTPTPTSFTISAANVTTTPTSTSDPFLSILSGVATSISGVSDVGGADSLISLGLWGADGQTESVQSGTLMHELGHSFTLTHGGLYPSPAGLLTIGPNCKPNYQSVMNYLFQVDLLDGTLDYSDLALNQGDESVASSGMGLLPRSSGMARCSGAQRRAIAMARPSRQMTCRCTVQRGQRLGLAGRRGRISTTTG
jgi:hypothetical protein